jgi:hypothetical protein
MPYGQNSYSPAGFNVSKKDSSRVSTLPVGH